MFGLPNSSGYNRIKETIMYVCICHAISEKDLKNLKINGKIGARELAALGLGESCGSCLQQAIDLLSDNRPQTAHKPKSK